MKSNLFNSFSDRARNAMQLAGNGAERLKHEYIGTEHILLGVAGSVSCGAASVLTNLCVELDELPFEIERLVQHGADEVKADELTMTPRARKVIEYATEEARKLKRSRVGTEHLLLGLMREGEGVACQLLMNLGVTLKDVRAEILRLYQQ